MKLTFDGISSHWEEGIPFGNGRMGAVLCSEPDADVLYLNDDTLWSGYPHAETSPLTPEIVAKARQASSRGDYVAATRIIQDATQREKDEQRYEPFGTARISTRRRPENGSMRSAAWTSRGPSPVNRSGWAPPTSMSTQGAALPMICWCMRCRRARRSMRA